MRGTAATANTPTSTMTMMSSTEMLLAAGIAQGINLPYGCKDGACGSCKCKMVSGSVTHGPHQSKALSDEEEAQGFVLPCCATATSDVVLESRQVTAEGALPIKKMPTRITLMEKKSPDVMRLLLQMPANEVFAYHAGQYIEFLLRDGLRRSYSMANAPHLIAQGLELHIRHMPGGKFTDQVFGSMKERDILRIEGPYGSFYLREQESKPIVLLASGTGFAPIKALIEEMQFKGVTRPATLYWGGRRPHDLYMDDWVKTKLTDAMDELLEIVMRDKAWNEELARKTYVAVLTMMSKPPATKSESSAPKGTLELAGKVNTTPADPLVDQYRRKLSMALF